MLYILSPDCKLVRGRSRAALYDLGHNTISLVPLQLLDAFSGKSIDSENLPKELSGIFNSLVDKQCLIREASIPVLELPSEEVDVSLISHCIIQYNEEFPFDVIASELSQLYCEKIVVIVDSSVVFNDLVFKLSPLYLVRGSSISLHMEYSDWARDHLEMLSTSSIMSIVFYGAPSDRSEAYGDCFVHYSQKRLALDACACSEFQLILNRRFYNESLRYNNCLYKKLTILRDGSISNCLFSPQRYGSVFACPSFVEIVSSVPFQECWIVSKDQIEGCKDCELRYACLDCRYANKGQFSLDRPYWCCYPINEG